MKRFILLLVLPLAACLPMKAESSIAACPSAGLEQVVFRATQDGAAIEPRALKDGALEWKVPGGAYLSCVYKNGFTRVQRMPGKDTTCTLGPARPLSCAMSI